MDNQSTLIKIIVSLFIVLIGLLIIDKIKEPVIGFVFLALVISIIVFVWRKPKR